MLQQQAVGDLGVAPPPDPWSGWAQVVDLPASVEYDLDDAEDVAAAADATDPETEVTSPAAPLPATPPPDERAAPATGGVDLAAAVAQLATELADDS